MAKGPTRKQQRQKEVQVVRRAKALELAIAGHSYARIAEILGCSKTTAHKDVKESLMEAGKHRKDLADELLDLELARLNSIHVLASQRAEAGDSQAMRVCLQASKQRSDLLGLGAPAKHEVTGADGAPLIPLEYARQAVAIVDDAKRGGRDGRGSKATKQAA